VVARSPIERLVAFKNKRGWRHLRLYSDTSGDYTRDYVSAEDADMPGFNVFTRQGGAIRHFWSGDMGPGTADPGQDPRGAPDQACGSMKSAPRRWPHASILSLVPRLIRVESASTQDGL